MLTAAGIGSGLDIESMISQLMALERRPLQQIQQRKNDVRVEISANGQLKGAISRFQSAAKALTDRDALNGVSAKSSDEAVVTVSAGSSADTGSHAITVTRLATTHRLSSAAFADADTAIGTGTLDIAVGGNTLSLNLADGNNTLAQVRDAINADPANPGVTASIITVDAGARLILTSNETGLANAISVTPGGGLAGMTLSEVEPALDAQLKVDGFDITSASNTVSGAIAGVTLTLKAAGSASVDFTSDSSGIGDAAQEFVNAYNGLRGNIKALRRTSLAGDSILLGIERSVNARLSSGVAMPDASNGFLFEAGITFDKEGDLNFDSAKLADAMAADPDRVFDLFGAEATGMGVVLDGFLDRYVAAEGLIDSRIESLESRDRTLDARVESAEFRLEKTEARLRKQFTALDSLLGQLQVTSSFLSQQLLSLPGAGSDQG